MALVASKRFCHRAEALVPVDERPNTSTLNRNGRKATNTNKQLTLKLSLCNEHPTETSLCNPRQTQSHDLKHPSFPHSNHKMAPRASADIVDTQDPPQVRLHGILLTWDPSILEEFVTAANDDVPVEFPELQLPQWLTESRGRLTAQGCVQDTMAYLAELSGGSHDTILSPLTPMQSDQLGRRMGHIEMHPFMQACARKLQTGSCLVSGTRFFQDPATDGELMNLASPPPPHRQIFG